MLRNLSLVACIVVAAPAFAKKTTLSASGQAVGDVVAQLGGPAEGDDSAIDKTIYQRAAAYIPSSTVVTENQDGTIYSVELSVDVDRDAVLGPWAAAAAPAQGRQH